MTTAVAQQQALLDAPPRGRPRHQAYKSTDTFLSSPSPSPVPVARKPRGPQNPVLYTPTRPSVRSPEPRQDNRAAPPAPIRLVSHVPAVSQSSPLPPTPATAPAPLFPVSSPKSIMQPDMTPLSFSRSPKRKRRSSSLNNSCMPTSQDAGCMAAILGTRQPARRRRASSSSRGRSQTRVEEHDSLLDDFQGYEREDSPRTTVSKRMSDLGLLDNAPRHNRDPSSFSNGASDVVTRTIDEEVEADGVHPTHIASQQSTSAKQHVAHPQRQYSQRDNAHETERKPSDLSKSTSSRTSYSAFPSPIDSPVSPQSPTSMHSSEYNSLSRRLHSPKRVKRSPSPPLGPRPVSPSRHPSLTSTNLSRKTSASVPKSAKSLKGFRRRAPSPPLTAGAEDPLVWHDSEITGHLMLDPDDDGTGINGVGFKPSKVEEEVRRMKRRQQVEAWKARENKADREERMRRRHTPDIARYMGQTGDFDGLKRNVRFEDDQGPLVYK